MPAPFLTCSYPFPEQEPPVEVTEDCLQCPRADRSLLGRHTAVANDDPELILAIHGFLSWFYADPEEGEYLDEVTRFAAEVYTGADHNGKCLPKAVLFAIYTLRQYDSHIPLPRLSPAAEAALKGNMAASWPDGEQRRTIPWSGLFRRENLR